MLKEKKGRKKDEFVGGSRTEKQKTLNYVCEAGAKDSKGPTVDAFSFVEGGGAGRRNCSSYSQFEIQQRPLPLPFFSFHPFPVLMICYQRYHRFLHPVRQSLTPRRPFILPPFHPSLPHLFHQIYIYTFFVREFGFTSWGRRTNDLSLMYATHTIPFPNISFFLLFFGFRPLLFSPILRDWAANNVAITSA